MQGDEVGIMNSHFGFLVLVLLCVQNVWGDILQFTTLVRGSKSGSGQPGRAVLRSEEKLQLFWEKHMSGNIPLTSCPFPLPTVDFEKYMVVGIVPKSERDDFFDSKILRIDELSEEIVVSFGRKKKHNSNGINPPFLQVFQFVLTKKSDKPVRFQKVNEAKLRSTGFLIEGMPRVVGRHCRPLLIGPSSTVKIGRVCFLPSGNSIKFKIRLTTDKCILLKSSVCSTLEVFETKSKATRFKSTLDMEKVCDFDCNFSNDTFVGFGNAVVECEETFEHGSEKLMMQESGQQREKKTRHSAAYQFDMICRDGIYY